MYCNNCGKAVDGTLRYCIGCGKRLTRPDDDKDSSPGKMLDNILTTLFLIVMFGMGILVGLVAVLLKQDVQTEVVVVIAIAYLASIFGICFSLVRQVPKLIDAKLRFMDRQHGQQLQAPPAANQLDSFREPASSVTDHTTRALNEIPR